MDKITSISNLLGLLRKPEQNCREPFVELLPEAKKLFGLEELEPISLDALLIQAIIRCVFEEDAEPENIEKDDAKKRDLYLLSMGLLKDYEHTKENGIHYDPVQRRNDYIDKSDFTEMFYHEEISTGLLTSIIQFN